MTTTRKGRTETRLQRWRSCWKACRATSRPWRGLLQGCAQELRCKFRAVATSQQRNSARGREEGRTLKPVGHQSTNWIVRFVLMVATAELTSLGTTSPLLS